MAGSANINIKQSAYSNAINQLENPLRIETVKKDIARVMTIMAEKNAKNA